MKFYLNKILTATALALVIAGCSSKPPHVQSISSAANPAAEIEKTETMLNEARERQVDALSPENYTDAKKYLDKAKKYQSEGKTNADVLEMVSYSRGWLNEANDKTALVETSMKDIADVRKGALRANAPNIMEKEWTKADKELREITTAVERGNLIPIEKKGNDVISRFRELEIRSLTKANLGIADENIQAAKKQGAEKKAPKTFDMANMKRENAEKVIKTDPRNSIAIRRASEDATRESMHLIDVVSKVSAGNTEDLVLTTERQQRTISNLRSENTSTEQELRESQRELSTAEREQQELLRKQAELEKSENLLKKAAQLRSQFRPNEAEVYADNGKLKIRLKTLQFPSGQANLGRKNQALLKKVETALADIEPTKITVEGHSDATGRSETNQMLSERRAQAVGDFLISEGTILGNKIESVGKGSDEPISDNNTPRGRAENRRIDLVIETE